MRQRVYEDDSAIFDGVRLFRRIHLRQIVKDEDTGLALVSSGAFRDKDLSANIETILQEDGHTPEYCLRNRNEHKLMSLTAGEARQYQQAVCRDPVPDDRSHGLVHGNKNNRRIHTGLRDAAAWVIPPEAPSYESILQEVQARLNRPGF